VNIASSSHVASIEMANAKEYLPPTLAEDVISGLCQDVGLPVPRSVKAISAAAAFHSVYVLSYAEPVLRPIIEKDLQNDGVKISLSSLILRVAGTHFTGIKTMNECAVLNWVVANTKVPVPRVIAYDETSNNIVGHEYMFMTMVQGQTIDTLYYSLSETEMNAILDQLMDILVQLHQHSWERIGGLQEIFIDGIKTIAPGPIVDETMWQVPELAKYWNGTETFSSLNISGPFESYTDLIIAQVKKSIYTIQRHDSLAPMRDCLPRINSFVDAIRKTKKELDVTLIRLAHRDLHFGNILYDAESGKITGVIDWEFASIVPFPRWDPSRAFLWDCGDSDESYHEKYRLRDVFFKRCTDKGVRIFEDANFTSERQEAMQLAASYLRAITEVLPRGRVERPWETWRADMLKNIDIVCS
jgi:aminoglycoside phosphotransferase (APT) family kinase protein